jgi:hypothetical protein
MFKLEKANTMKPTHTHGRFSGLKALFQVTPLNIVVYGFVLMWIFGVAIYDYIAQASVSSTEVATTTQLLDKNINHSVNILDVSDRFATILNFGLWMIVGAVIYIIFWLAINIIIDSYNNIVVSQAFVHPNSFQKSRYWFAVVGRIITRTAAGFLCLSLLFYFFKALYPLSLNLIRGSIPNLGSVDGLALLLLVAIGLLAALHLMSILLRLTLLRIPSI